MPIVPAARAPRALAALALLGLSLALTACVSDSSGAAFSPPIPSPTSGLPTPKPAATMPPIPRNQPAAIVAGTPIPGAEYADAVAQQRKAATYQMTLQPGMTPPTDLQLRTFVLNTLIERNVVLLYAKAHGITVSPAQVRANYSNFQVRYGGVISFTNTLKNFGYTPATFLTQLHDSALRQKVMQRVAPLPAMVQAARARHILVKTKALADRLYAQLQRNPLMFAALAAKYSTDTGSKAQGGELGIFPPGVMVPPFDHAAFTQPVGVIGKPVQSQFGYHIIQVEQRPVPLAIIERSPQQNQQILQQLSQQQTTVYQRWLTAERIRLHVRVLAKGVPQTP